MRLGRQALVAVTGLAMLAAQGCASSVPPPPKPAQQAKPAALKPACAQPPVQGKPSLCELDDGTTYVVGLPSGHAWQRGARALLSVERPGLSEGWPAALAVVVEAGADAAKVSILYQREAKIDGAAARVVGNDAHLGKFVGRVKAVDGGRALIEVGSDDGVVASDVYELRAGSGTGLPIGRVRVTEVADLSAWGVLLDQTAEITIGTTAVFGSAADPASAARGVTIVVVNFHPMGGQTAQSASQTFANKFANELGNAAAKAKMEGITVRYEPSARVALLGSDDTGHAEARRVGKQCGADIVVWGAMECNKRACAHPRFTVVDPAAFGQRGARGTELRMDRTDAGFALIGQDADGLASAILGTVAYEAQRYGDAVFYLGKAVAKQALAGEDMLQGYGQLAHAQYVRGQTVGSRAHATELRNLAQKAGKPLWEMVGRGELVWVDLLEGKIDSARGHLQQIRKWAEAQDQAGALAFALNGLGELEADQGQVEEARKLYEESLAVQRRIGNVQGEAATLHNLAVLQAQQGRVDQAGKLFQDSLEKKRRIGDVQGEAATLHNLAILEAQQGRMDQAHKLFQDSLEKKRRIGDVLGEAATLHQLAVLEVQQGRVDQARKLFQDSLEKKRRIGDVLGEAATLHELAGLEAQQGRVDQARKLFQDSLEKSQRIGDVLGEAATLHALAVLEAQQGRVDQARKLFQDSLDKSRRIGDEAGALATQVSLAVLDFRAGKQKEGRASIEDALRRAQAIGHVEYQARCHNWLGAFDRIEGRLTEARTQWNEALALYQKLGMPKEIQELTEQLASLGPLEKIADAWRAHAALLAGGGILVTRVVPNGQAEKAKLQPGDILIRYGKDRLDKAEALRPLAEGTDAKKTVTIELIRGKDKLTVQVHGGLLGIAIDALPPRPAAASASTGQP